MWVGGNDAVLGKCEVPSNASWVLIDGAYCFAREVVIHAMLRSKWKGDGGADGGPSKSEASTESR